MESASIIGHSREGVSTKIHAVKQTVHDFDL